MDSVIVSPRVWLDIYGSGDDPVAVDPEGELKIEAKAASRSA
jgi:hypothetical protein